MAIKKPKIYDLARALTLDETDEKIKKQKQSDLTKRIIDICTALGFPTKSQSASMDHELIKEVITVLNSENGTTYEFMPIITIINDIVLNKNIKVEKEIPEEDKPKKLLKIVRRIKPQEAIPEVPVEELANEVKVEKIPEPESIIKEERVEKKEPDFNLDIPVIPEIAVNGPRKSKDQYKELKEDKDLQPFRVAKPTLSPSMMGRTKRPVKKRSMDSNKEKEKEKKHSTITLDKPAIITLSTALTVKDLSTKLLVPETEVIKFLFAKGIIRTVNQLIELELAKECAQSLGYEVQIEDDRKVTDLKHDISLESDEDLFPRPPVVTIMGHVDHGKTTLLDAIREAKFNITEQEKGGITQHIGAYQIEVLDYDGNKRKITFLDTPGHEAFTQIRARGAQLTDIAILVVAADDGVMPQTIEALDHAKSAEVPIIIALNKMDKEGAQPDRVLGELAEHDLLVEDYGGKVVCSKISAKKKQNLDDLLTKITLVADAELSNKLRANPNRPASGVVIEAELSKEKGPMAHILVQSGTLRKGDCIVAGAVAGRIRAMFDDHGREVEQALPSMPVEILGLPGVPHSGDTLQVYSSYQEAKKVAEEKHTREKEKRRSLGLVEFASKVREGQAHELKIIIKSDMHGSAEAVAQEVSKLSTNEVLIKPIHIGSGNITESDINLAASSQAIVIGFHVTPDANAQKISTDLGVDVRCYEIIYKITEDLEKAVLGLLEPEKEEVKVGSAQVRQIFTFGKGSKIAGCYVTEGKIQRNQKAKVLRNGKVVHEGTIDNLKRFKDDAKEVQTNFECGISFSGFNDLQENDVIECWTVIEKERTKL